MDFESCFERASCAPRSETFSYRSLPCRIESPSKPPAAGSSRSDPSCRFRDYCDGAAGALKLLERVYGR
jgi:hypothetical protein